MNPNLIYHITTSDWWNGQTSFRSYTTQTLREEGFIHCSTLEQIEGTLERYYAHQQGLLLLHIDTSLLQPELKFEQATNGQLFPHVYGEINKSAIVNIEQLT
jgi:uncharacterized protein (DUF952 family)